MDDETEANLLSELRALLERIEAAGYEVRVWDADGGDGGRGLHVPVRAEDVEVWER